MIALTPEQFAQLLIVAHLVGLLTGAGIGLMIATPKPKVGLR